MIPLQVLATKKFFPQDIEYISSALDGLAELCFPAAYDVDSIAASAGTADVLLGGLVSRVVLEQATHCRLIQIPWTGVDALDFSLLSEFSIPACNSHSNSRAVAEYAFALTLALSKQIPVHDRLLRQGQWGRPRPDGSGFFQPPASLVGKTAGILGTGAIGRHLGDMLSAFGMACIGTRKNSGAGIPDGFKEIFPSESHFQVASEADVLIITLPLTSSTRNLIDQDVFQAMKPESFLVSVSRGAIIDQGALFKALDTKMIAGAAIDTWYQYPTADNPDTLPSGDYPFETLDNLILSPHRAGFLAGQMPHLDDAIDNIRRLAQGKPLLNEIMLNEGY